MVSPVHNLAVQKYHKFHVPVQVPITTLFCFGKVISLIVILRRDGVTWCKWSSGMISTGRGSPVPHPIDTQVLSLPIVENTMSTSSHLKVQTLEIMPCRWCQAGENDVIPVNSEFSLYFFFICRLATPELGFTGDACLSFSYSFIGNQIGSLVILTTELSTLENSRKTVWSEGSYQQETLQWMQTNLKIHLPSIKARVTDPFHLFLWSVWLLTNAVT